VRYTLFIYLFTFCACAVSRTPEQEAILDLQKANRKEDTSHVYALPYPKGKSYLMIQGYFTRFSHKNRAAIDFKMKRGTTVTAARDGIVVRVKEDGDKGGLKPEYRAYGNNVVIEHNDGTRAGYWHLQKDGALVNVGDSVKTGQAIALSGKTGYTALPHLHFLVWTNKNGQWQQIPTRFQTKKGDKYLRPFRWYRNKRANY
jgi:murein DD-endopeptidase MepM/ murein hydrolase activator NlpD